MRPYWPLQLLAYLCMFGITGISLYMPQIIRRVVDQGIGQANLDALAQSVFLLLILTVFRGIMRFGEGYMTERVSQGVSYDLRNHFYHKLEQLSFSYHDRAQTGELLSRTTSDVERLQRLTGRGLLGLLNAGIMIIGTTVILISMQPVLAILSLAAMPVITILMRKYVQRQHPLWRSRQEIMADLTSRVEQNLYGIGVVRGFAQEDAELERFAHENDNIFGVSMRITRRQSRMMPLIVLLASASTVVILWVGGAMVIQGILTLGALVAFNSYMLQLIGPMRRIGFLITMLGESHASAQRVFDVLDAESDVVDVPGAADLGEIRGEVAFEHVSFGYFDGSPVLKDVSFQVEPGQVVALLGPTGSGKSTITNLIPRFYDVGSGSIKIDGVDVRDVTLDSLRSQIGIVLQETTLFGSTVRENIAFGRPEATQEEIEQAAKAAAAHDFIMEFPNGYDTEVGERGSTLSGGQRQRVAIARALLLDPRILILDDATSSVDTETEQKIQQALKNLMRGRTSFVIAQRVSTVRDADMILVVDKGELCAQGRHQDLIRESGIYADIYYRQLRQEDIDLAQAVIGGTA